MVRARRHTAGLLRVVAAGVGLAVLLLGCGGGDADDGEATSSPSTTPADAPTPNSNVDVASVDQVLDVIIDSAAHVAAIGNSLNVPEKLRLAARDAQRGADQLAGGIEGVPDEVIDDTQDALLGYGEALDDLRSCIERAIDSREADVATECTHDPVAMRAATAELVNSMQSLVPFGSRTLAEVVAPLVEASTDAQAG
jgi:hypothetical protein